LGKADVRPFLIFSIAICFFNTSDSLDLTHFSWVQSDDMIIKDMVISKVMHWGPGSNLMNFADFDSYSPGDIMASAVSINRPLGESYNWQYMNRIVSGKATGIVKVWAGESAIVYTTEDGGTFVWGMDEKAEHLLVSPDLTTPLANIKGTVLQMDQGASLSRFTFSNTGPVIAPMPSPDGDPLLRTVIFPFGDKGGYNGLALSGDWFSGGQPARVPKFTPLNVAEILAESMKFTFSATKLLSWGVGSRHIIMLSTRDGVKKLWSAGDPDNRWGALGFDVTDRNVASARMNLVAIEGLAPSNVSLVAAGPTSSWAVVVDAAGQRLFWWGKFAGNTSPLQQVQLDNVVGKITSISVGWYDNAFILDDTGRIYSMGVNSYAGYDGWLCLGSAGLGLPQVDAPRLIPTPSVNWTSVSAGGGLIAFIGSSQNGSRDVYQCGRSDFLGFSFNASAVFGSFVDIPLPLNVSSLGIQGVAQVAAGGSHAVILSSDGVYWHVLAYFSASCVLGC
jgi:hypothetical protein